MCKDFFVMNGYRKTNINTANKKACKRVRWAMIFDGCAGLKYDGSSKIIIFAEFNNDYEQQFQSG